VLTNVSLMCPLPQALPSTKTPSMPKAAPNASRSGPRTGASLTTTGRPHSCRSGHRAVALRASLQAVDVLHVALQDVHRELREAGLPQDPLEVQNDRINPPAMDPW